MSRRWSKLRTSFQVIMREGCDIKFEVYRMKSQRGTTNLPYIRILDQGKIIWSYPPTKNTQESVLARLLGEGDPLGDFIRAGAELDADLDNTSPVEDWENYAYPYDYTAQKVTDVLRQYLNCPKTSLCNFTGHNSPAGLIKALYHIDRRLGKKYRSKNAT